ncbi:MAG: putative inorganic carbon transporter subunit DabA, partial [Pseudomonadota bacterium]
MHITSEALGSREQIIAALDHLDHVLPGQGPIHDFVHHNTIHGFQHLPFEQALAAYEALTGTFGYLPEAQNREFYQQGRINDRDLFAALAHNPQLQSEQIVGTAGDLTITRKDIYRIAMLFDLQPLTVSQLNWQIEELDALGTVQADVPEQVRRRLLANSTDQSAGVRQLWESISDKLGLEQVNLHPENMLDLSLDQAEVWLEKIHSSDPDSSGLTLHQRMRQQAAASLDELLAQLGDGITLRGFVLALSGIDILYSVRPQMIRICASALDEGVAAWQLP